MLDITNHQGNANQNPNEESINTCQNGSHQKKKKREREITSTEEDVEKRKPLYIISRNVNK